MIFSHVKEKGLYPKVVPGQQKAFFLFVVQSECKHAVQAAWKGIAVLLVSVNDDFCVAVGIKAVPFFQEVVFQLPVVVYLSVENDSDGAIFVVHGLASAGQVDDGKAAHAQADAIAHLHAFIVGTAMKDCGAHRPDLPVVRGRTAVIGCYSADAAHKSNFRRIRLSFFV